MSDVKDSVLSKNFTTAWEQVFSEKFADSVIKAMKQNTDIVSKAVKQNKESLMKKDNFTLERLLGCEVLFSNRYKSSKGYISNVDNGCSVTLDRGVIITLPNMSRLTFFTEDGDELTFDEYVAMYYGS